MSPIVVTESKGGGSFSEGWHTVTIDSVVKDDYNGSPYLDIRFKDYPESLKLRVWETRNKDGEEFVITNLVRYSNPDVLEELPSKNGSAVAKLDDSPNGLIGKSLQVLFYKNANGYVEVSQKVAPATPFKNVVDDFSEDRIEGIKSAGEKYQNKRNADNNIGTTTATSSSDAIADPF